METSKPRILVVDDEPDMVASLEELLRKAGFDAEGASTGAQMHEALRRHACSLILLDLRLRSEDGLTLARELRQRSAIPIIMISGASDETDRVLLLELAADDFLVKPFSPRELVARVRAVLRRYAVETGAPASNAPRLPRAAGSDQIRFGDWILDLAERELVHLDGSPCPLTQAEYRLLEAFVRQPQRVWTRDQLLERTRSLETEVFDRTIDVLILRLRRKIESNPKHPQYICTERGLGYVFAAPVVRREPAQ
ncbi:MAG TPA: response regulator transcription factor [Albitalea sp.]|nr:response regulator transcription factor [Albitalea sp.]